jgi:hypothetical protein
MRRQLLPAADVGALYQQLLAAALKLAETARDDKTRLGALHWAGSTLEKIRKLKEAARTADEAKKPADERAEVIEELQRLFAKALPGKADDPVVERMKDEQKLEETLAAGAGDEAASAAKLLEEIRHPREERDPDPPAVQVRYIEKCISKPGHFPPRFVKIAVRNPPSPDAS